MFLRYLESQGIRHDFGPGALPALALLIAESPASNKDTMIRITINAISDVGATARCEDEDGLQAKLDLRGSSDSSEGGQKTLVSEPGM